MAEKKRRLISYEMSHTILIRGKMSEDSLHDSISTHKQCTHTHSSKGEYAKNVIQ